MYAPPDIEPIIDHLVPFQHLEQSLAHSRRPVRERIHEQADQLGSILPGSSGRLSELHLPEADELGLSEEAQGKGCGICVPHVCPCSCP